MLCVSGPAKFLLRGLGFILLQAMAPRVAASFHLNLRLPVFSIQTESLSSIWVVTVPDTPVNPFSSPLTFCWFSASFFLPSACADGSRRGHFCSEWGLAWVWRRKSQVWNFEVDTGCSLWDQEGGFSGECQHGALQVLMACFLFQEALHFPGLFHS